MVDERSAYLLLVLSFVPRLFPRFEIETAPRQPCLLHPLPILLRSTPLEFTTLSSGIVISKRFSRRTKISFTSEDIFIPSSDV